jgi:predicted ATPase/class 3 adenylate cyclase/DNA-binding CsgD family transcriptional regulator
MLATMSERADTPPVNWSELGVSELPTGMVTLLLADVEGSTRLWQTRPDDMTAAVALLDRTLPEVSSAHGGVRPVEQGEGDSFVIAFSRASDALACALELQRAPLAPIRLRIGLHTGEVQLRDEGNYIGPTINRTARLRDLAHGGQTVLSGVTEQMIADRLPADAWLIDLGTHQLRDLPRPEHVIQLCHPDLRNEFPLLRTSKSIGTHNFPVLLTRFVGRGAQMADVRTLLADNRLVTLTGAGGAGKTRLAVEIAARIAGEFREGAWYVDLAPITQRAVVADTVARALGLPDQPGRSTMDTLVGFVSHRQMLIVLDNCEHLLDATASLVIDLLGACPELALLATSREPTGVPGEVTFLVPSLSLADEAIELFADRARRVRPGFGVTEGSVAATVTEICRRLDGMPLAIELAAARVRALSLDEILDSLHDRFRLLTGAARTAVRRQQTLRASVDWSHALLTETEQVLFRRLAAFVGGFDLDAAQAVAGTTEVERYQVLDQLTLLVDKSLVLAETTDAGRTRYRFLETVRQYALEKLGESGEASDVRSRHRDYYTTAAALLDMPASTDYQRRREQVESEIDNLRAAFAWSRENSDVAEALRLASSLQPLWLTGGSGSGPWGRPAEGLAWFEAVLADRSVQDADVLPAVRARALADWAVLDAAVGAANRLDEAHDALTIARELDDPRLLTRALFASGSVCVDDPETARSYFAEALALARTSGDDWMACDILAWRAYTAYIEGEPIAACRAAEEGRELADAIGDGYVSRHCRWTLSMAQIALGDLATGLKNAAELMEDAEAAHDVLRWANSLLTQAHGLVYHGEWSRARAAAGMVATVAPELGPVHQGLACTMLALASLAAGDVAAAAEASEDAQRWLASVPVTAAVRTASPVAEIALARGDLAMARRLADDAVSGAPGVFRSRELTTRARVALAQGELEQAARDAHDALAYAADNRTLLEVPNTLECLAYVEHSVGSHQEAARLFGASDAIRQRTGEVRFTVHQAAYESFMAAVRNTLSDNEFDQAWAEGAALSIDEAIAYAQRGRGERKRPSSGWASLTPTELDVVKLVREGLSNKEIATRLFVSPRTVQTHLTHVYTKLGLTSRVQLVQEASRHG